MSGCEKNVYEITLERTGYIFSEFENIYVAFSGGKDSGVMLNIVLDYMRRHGIKRKIGVLYMDVEASYKRTARFIERMYLDNLDLIEPYWVCLPMTTTNAVSMYEPFWIFWDPAKKDKWVRPMPEYDFIINKDNHPFDFYRENMTFEEFTPLFGDWYARRHGDKKTACLIGIRADESLNRYHAVSRKDKLSYKDKSYSTRISDNTYNFYPICDWRTEDIWTYNGRYRKPYNSIYDLFYLAGVPLSRMRICEPYGDEQKAGLNLFKVLEPETWVRVVDRVSGANFGNIYCGTKATGAGRISLPGGHTWKSYCKFLLRTLPGETRRIYTAKFIKFIRYWNRIGSPVSEEDIFELDPDMIVNTRQYSKRGKGDKYVVRFKTIPDALPGLDNKTDFLSWKRMCMAILKNDITCRTLSFSMTKKQILRQQELIRKYEEML
ncbi:MULTISPECIES: DUF3440 domain-containing protein [unclassified Dysgonomonas]|jgi:predicted phosphoadenosine phosphosulfate sulfurtransferase|uniref:DUF3440 domain-containing protein n=1 Tax=unclassified Dysgonomonas TaxID=2630389 RepID=UPI0025C60CD8|nr:MULTISPECIES: DUF3440 domain-containing protein [unclassified Dysgonomonas]MDR2002179.1 DUF3440 domain-containing protein [Prevotella sp.]HMM03410.1 DUF3440 domain-containing protein [Dysgonomonas sp.]